MNYEPTVVRDPNDPSPFRRLVKCTCGEIMTLISCENDENADCARQTYRCPRCPLVIEWVQDWNLDGAWLRRTIVAAASHYIEEARSDRDQVVTFCGMGMLRTGRADARLLDVHGLERADCDACQTVTDYEGVRAVAS